MRSREEVEYTVVLIFPGFGTERENAETIVESALQWLNTFRENPGFRFAPYVSAHLEMVQDADEARERIESDDHVAMVLVHDLPDDERDDLLRFCEARHISAGHTVDVPRRPGPRKGPMKIVFGRTPSDRPPAHRAERRDADTSGRRG